ncbi:MAG: hypothetical protein M0Z72_04730, partial [Deltaproteobacteria bacterium]|nr:hypothetical protein [Deltaproteobacteria bacterium]
MFKHSKSFRLTIFLFLLFYAALLTPSRTSAQIITLDPVTVGIQSIIQSLTAANTAIQAAESKIEVELSALKYVRQGEQLMNQIRELQQESSSLISAVNNIEGTIMMPAAELQGLKNSLTAEQGNMQSIIAEESGNPQMSQFLQNYHNKYGSSGLSNATTNQSYYGNVSSQYQTAGTQSAQTAAYAQSVLNNSQNSQHLISQLGANVAAAHGTVAAEQANGQALVALAEEVNQLNKLEAQKAKLAAMQAGTVDSQQAAGAQHIATVTTVKPYQRPAAEQQTSFGTWP